MNKFKNKVVVITGAVSGIGLEVVNNFVEGGAKIVLLDINSEKVQSLAVQIALQNIEVMSICANIGNSNEIDNAAIQIMKKFGKIDIWINNAGINGGPMKPVWEMGDEQWLNTQNINLNGTFYGTRAAMRNMLDTGGSIVNVASIMGLIGMENISHYVASKHAVIGLTKAAAIDGGPKNIRVNAVAPTFIRTALMESVPEEIWKELIASHPLGRVPSAKEVANLITFLASDDACAITGSTHLIDCGITAH